ncbi:MAG TPA: DUF6636 domain-containing protein [Gaiellales bacterium]|nr:DUF6636 domain-containing protein [Gaiellales bacterium]
MMRRAILVAMLVLAAAGTGSAAADPVVAHFRSPTGNINCIGGTSPAYVECQVRHAAWPQRPPRPLNCDLDWEPYNLSLGNRRVGIGACRGDVGPRCFHDCTTLRYGRSVNIGPIRCRSAAIGVTCRYVHDKHAGFRIAREGYIVWRA